MKRNDTNPGAGTIRLALVPAALVWLSACAPVASSTGPETPAPTAEPDEERPPDAEPVADTGELAPPATDSIADLEARLVEMARAVRGPEPELPPIKPYGVSWSP
ncbi:MAG: hypothetical protein ACOC9N_01740, partial [Gemmatimonadota bacterium]